MGDLEFSGRTVLVVGGSSGIGNGMARAIRARGAEVHRVNGIAPGLVDTKLTKVTTDHPERLRRALAGLPAGRLGTPADIAGAALFLASPLAAYVCGRTLRVDGGLCLQA